MLSRYFQLALLPLAAFLFCSLTLRASEIQVSAAASLKEAIEEIAAAYEKESGDIMRLNFAGSNVLARQIQEGAPVDIFLSADEARMDVLQKDGLLLDGSRKSVLSNSLVIVVEKASDYPIRTAADLASSSVKRLALADPASVPAGVYAKEYLQNAGVWEQVRDRVIPAENVRGALAAVASGNVEAGIVYRTDAAVSKDVKVAFEVPADLGPKISYPFAIIKASKDPLAAGKVLEFLISEKAIAVFKKHGFLILN